MRLKIKVLLPVFIAPWFVVIGVLLLLVCFERAVIGAF